jgi:hypothetical protein
MIPHVFGSASVLVYIICFLRVVHSFTKRVNVLWTSCCKVSHQRQRMLGGGVMITMNYQVLPAMTVEVLVRMQGTKRMRKRAW